MSTSTDYLLLVSTAGLEATADNLQKGMLYYFYVTASNMIGESTNSVAQSFLAATVPAAPNRPHITS
jgi:hypothetical protein